MKITPEIEAVARAIYQTWGRNDAGWRDGRIATWDQIVRESETDMVASNLKKAAITEAVAAIRALREPTDKMLINSYPAHSYEGLRASYTAMIDAALGENK